MAIIIQKLITIEEVKSSEIYNPTDEENNIWGDNYINEAISIATLNMNHWTGGVIFKRLPTMNEEDTNLIKFACLKYVFHLLRKGLEYMRGQSSSTLGGMSWSMSNPDDPYYVPPEVQIALKQTGLLVDIMFANTKTPLDDAYNYTITDPSVDLDGNTFKPTIKDCNAWYVRYDRIYSKDKTILFNFGNDPDKKILDLSINVGEATSKQIQDELNKWKVGVVYDIKTEILSDKGFNQTVEEYMKKWLENDTQFKESLDNSIKKLLEDDNNFIEKTVEKVFTTIEPRNYLNEIAQQSTQYLIPDTSFLTNLASQTVLQDDLTKQKHFIEELVSIIQSRVKTPAIVGEIRAFGEVDKAELEKQGWRQLELNNGYALLNAFDSGQKVGVITSGHIAKHTHTIDDPGHQHDLYARWSNDDNPPYKSDFNSDEFCSPGVKDEMTIKEDLRIRHGTYSNTTGITINEEGLNGDNLSAGLYVNYFIYDPEKIYDVKTATIPPKPTPPKEVN